MPKADLSRRQIPTLTAPSVSPAPQHSGAYLSKPAAQDTGGALHELADALSSFSPALEQYAANSKAQAATKAQAHAKADAAAQEAERERQQALAEQRLAGMTIADVQSAMKAGTLNGYDNPYFKEAADNVLGRRSVATLRATMEAEIEAGEIDPVATDLGDVLSQRIAEAGLDQASRSFAAGFTKQAEEFRIDLLETQHSARQADYEAKADTIAFEALADAIESSDPSSVSAALQRATADLAPMIGVSHGRLDAIQIEIAEALAERGEVEMVEAILKGNRTAADGSSVGALSSKKGMGKKAETLITRAKTVQEAAVSDTFAMNNYALSEQRRSGKLTNGMIDAALRSNEITPSQANTQKEKLATETEKRLKAAKEARDLQRIDRMTEATLASASVQMFSGRGYEIEDVTLEVGDAKRTIKAKTIKDQILTQAATELQASLPEGPEGTALFRMSMQDSIRGSGATLKQWRSEMDNLQTDLEIMRATGEIPARVSNAIDLFSSLDTDVAEAHVKDAETLGFLRAIKDMTGPSMGLTVEDAVVRVTSLSELPSTARRAKATASVLKEARKQSIDFSSLPFKDGLKAEGRDASHSAIAEIAASMAQYSDLPDTELVALASERFMGTHVAVAGHPVKVPDGHDSKAFGFQAKSFLEGWAMQRSAEAGDEVPADAWDDVYLKPGPGGGYRIYQNGLPVFTGREFSPEAISRTSAVLNAHRQQERDAKDRAKAVKKAEKAEQRQDEFDEWVKETGAPQVEAARQYRDQINSRRND